MLLYKMTIYVLESEPGKVHVYYMCSKELRAKIYDITVKCNVSTPGKQPSLGTIDSVWLKSGKYRVSHSYLDNYLKMFESVLDPGYVEFVKGKEVTISKKYGTSHESTPVKQVTQVAPPASPVRNVSSASDSSTEVFLSKDPSVASSVVDDIGEVLSESQMKMEDEIVAAVNRLNRRKPRLIEFSDGDFHCTVGIDSIVSMNIKDGMIMIKTQNNMISCHFDQVSLI